MGWVGWLDWISPGGVLIMQQYLDFSSFQPLVNLRLAWLTVSGVKSAQRLIFNEYEIIFSEHEIKIRDKCFHNNYPAHLLEKEKTLLKTDEIQSQSQNVEINASRTAPVQTLLKAKTDEL